MSELYIPISTNTTILRPHPDGWSMHLWRTNVPAVIDSESVIFRPSDSSSGALCRPPLLRGCHDPRRRYRGPPTSDLPNG